MRKYTLSQVLGAATLLAAASVAYSADVRPALLYDLGGKFDRSFNENAYNGAARFSKQYKIHLWEFEPQNEAQREQALRVFAQQSADPIIAVGFSWAPAMKKIAPSFAKTRFVLIDSKLELPNVESIEFAYNESGFLVGALAAMKSKTGTVGFVGGMDTPLIRDYECAYDHGVHYVNLVAKVLHNMTGTTSAAWKDPARGRELALGQFDQGADVVFGAAGATTVGILQAAADAKKLAIGEGINQNGLQPGHVLTTAALFLDQVVYSTLVDAQNGTWKPGYRKLGLKDHSIGWSLDDNNRPLLTSADIARIDDIQNKIIAGDIKVPEYLGSGTCSAL